MCEGQVQVSRDERQDRTHQSDKPMCVCVPECQRSQDPNLLGPRSDSVRPRIPYRDVFFVAPTIGFTRNWRMPTSVPKIREFMPVPRYEEIKRLNLAVNGTI